MSWGRRGVYETEPVAWKVGAEGLAEQPRLSRVRWLDIWQHIMSLAGCHEGWVVTCGYGPFDVGWIRKEFAFLGGNCSLMEIHRRVPAHHPRSLLHIVRFRRTP